MIRTIFITSIFVICIIYFYCYVFQRQYIYFPNTETPQQKDFHAQDMTQVTLTTKDNLKLLAWYKAAKPNQPTILFLHGNAGHIGYRLPLIRQFIQAGLGVLLLEYRGYGGNLGSPSEQGLYQDGRAAMQFLLNHGLKSNQIILYGESLGTGIATKLATEHSILYIVLQSPFTSMTNLSRYHYPWLILNPWDKFDSLSRINQIHAPLLIIHGKLDTVVPYSQGLEIYKQANQPKSMITFDKFGHNDLWSAPGFVSKVLRFIHLNTKVMIFEKDGLH